MLTAGAAVIGACLIRPLARRLTAAFWTLRARAWVPSVSRLLSGWVNATDYTGDAFLEPDAHAKEMTLLGYTTRNKTLIVRGYVLIPLRPSSRRAV